MPEALFDRAASVAAHLDVPPPGHENAEARDLVARHHGENWIRALAVNPATARRFAAYFESLFDPAAGRLPIAERELIAVAVSTHNGCGLCEIHHTIALGKALGDPVKAHRTALDDHLAPLTERERALVDFARKVAAAPKSIAVADFTALRAVGLDDQEILEALETSAWFNHTNRIFIALGVRPDEKYFAA